MRQTIITKRRTRRSPAGNAGSVGTTLACLLTFARAAEAQQVIAPPAEVPVIPPAQQQFQTNGVGYIAAVETPAPEMPPLQWGPVDLHPHADYHVSYGDGIQSSPGHGIKTVINEISPGMLFNAGRHWSLDYTPTWRFYSSKLLQNTLDHNVRLAGWAAYEDWVFGLSQGYTTSSAPLVETGIQTFQEAYATAITASYRFNSKVSVDLAVNQNFVSAQSFQSFREWSTLDWVNYQFWPRLNLAFGAGVGHVNLDVGTDMTYESYHGRISWRATEKVSLEANVGLEDRQFLGAGVPDLVSPIFGFSLVYQPVEVTTFTLTASRAVSASYFQNLVTKNTGVSAGLSQRLFKKFYLGLNGSYANASYIATARNAIFPGRSDDFYSFSARLSHIILKRGSVALTYQYNDNSSSQAGYSFASNQIGLELSYKY
ncbi:MAG TPA: outer membrane beta-barrel protein [Verrucomicrobiae bacterium]|nr:outer membrane beta-barrel protein [Verrucomicrobiae bacterium]